MFAKELEMRCDYLLDAAGKRPSFYFRCLSAQSCDPRKLAGSDSSESAHQIALFAWRGLMLDAVPDLAMLYAYPVGGFREPKTAARMKAEGAAADIPDLFLAVMRTIEWDEAVSGGLYIEMKKGKEKPRPGQAAMLGKLREQGYAATYCSSWQEAALTILNYLENGTCLAKS